MSQADDTQEGEMSRMQEALRSKDRELAEAKQELARRDATPMEQSEARRESAKGQQDMEREMRDFSKATEPSQGQGLGSRMTSSRRSEETIQRHSSHMPALPMGSNTPHSPPRLQPVVMQFYCYVKGELKVISINCLHDDEPVRK
jgi:hypothetical protein